MASRLCCKPVVSLTMFERGLARGEIAISNIDLAGHTRPIDMGHPVSMLAPCSLGCDYL